MTKYIIVLFLVFFLFVHNGIASDDSLQELFARMKKKKDLYKTHLIMDYISKAAPDGVDQANPKIAEYETFKSDKSANFLNDGMGHVVFRQFRRLRISDVLANINHRPYLKK